MGKRKCAECGFLTIRNTDTKQLDFFNEAWRESGTYPGDNPYSGPPVCFVGACSFRETDGRLDRTRISRLITKEWECGEFMELRGCLSARDHWDMRHAEAMAKIAAEHRETDKRFQEEVRQRDREWQEKQKTNDRKWRFIEIAVAAILGAIFGIAGSWFKPSPPPMPPALNPIIDKQPP